MRTKGAVTRYIAVHHGNSVVTDKVRQTLLEAFRKGFNVTSACNCAGIATTTYYNYVKADPTFEVQVRSARMETSLDVAGALIKSAKKGDVRAQKFYLQSKHPDEFPRDNKQLNVNVLAQLPDERLTSRIDRMLELTGRVEEDTAEAEVIPDELL